MRPIDDPTTTVHTGVWERADAGPGVTAAVFLELRARHLRRARRARRRGQHGRDPRWQRGHRGPPRLTPPHPNLHVPPTFWGRSVSDPDTDLPQMCGSGRLVGEPAFCCKVCLMIAVSRPRRILLTTLSTLCIAMAAGAGASAATDTTVPDSSGPPAGGDEATYPITIAHKYGETTVEEFPERIAVVGLLEQDALIGLGVVPVATTEWFGEHAGAVWPWAADELEALGAEPPVGARRVGGDQLRERRRPGSRPHPGPLLRAHRRRTTSCSRTSPRRSPSRASTSTTASRGTS